MATSGTIRKKVQDQGLSGIIYLIVDWERIGFSINDNTTTIRYTPKLETKYIAGQVDIQYSLQIGNSNTFSATQNFSLSLGTTICSFDPIEITSSNNSNGEFDQLCKLNMKWGASGYSYDFNISEYITIEAIPVKATLTRVDNFNDEENYTIYYNNPSRNTITVDLYTVSGSRITSPIGISDTAGMAIIPISDADRIKIRQLMTRNTSMKVKVNLKSSIFNPITGAVEIYFSSLYSTISLINHEPILNPTVKDINRVTTALTGDNSKFIKYFSNLYFDTGAVTKKEATIKNQYITCGSQSKENYTSLTGIFRKIDSNTVYFGMTDSRDLTVKDSIVVDLIPYVKLTASLILEPLSLAGDMRIDISGNYYNGSFGAKNNSLQFQYGIRENGGDITWVIIEPTITYGDNTYEASYTISGLNPNSTYQITAKVTDALMNVQSREESITSTPIFDWGKTDFKHNTPVYLTKNLSLRVVDNDGYDVSVFNPCDSNGTLVLGWGQYDKANGDTSIYGNNINLTAKEKIKINGTEIGGKILWEGEDHMNASQVATLSEPVSQQINGIVLVFSLYRDGYAEDASLHSFFISKKEVELMPNAPHTFFLMINSGFSVVGAKYLYIADNAITGNATNAEDGSNNGFTYKNRSFVLRYVIGV